MKKTGILLLLGLFVAVFISAETATQTETSVPEPKVDDLIGLMAEQTVKKHTAPIKQEAVKLEKRVQTVEQKLQDVSAQEQKLEVENQKRLEDLQRCEKGLQELGSTLAEDPKQRTIKLAGCAGAGAVTAILFLLLL